MTLAETCTLACGRININNDICEALTGLNSVYMPFIPHCCACRKQWQWSDGRPMGFLFWDDYEPVKSGGLCGFSAGAFNSKWAAASCDEKKGFVCARGESLTLPAVTSSSPVDRQPEVSSSKDETDDKPNGRLLVSNSGIRQKCKIVAKGRGRGWYVLFEILGSPLNF